MLQNEVAKRANTKPALPITFVLKKYGSLHFSVDHRLLNTMVICDCYVFQNMHECIEFLESVAIFSTVDDNLGYRQIEMDEKACTELPSRSITADITTRRFL